MSKILLILVTGTILSFSAIFINELSLLMRLLIKSAMLLSFPFILYLFNFYEEVELKAIRGFFRKWSNLRNLGSNIKSLKNINESINDL
jgi:hypothetical protein